MHTINKSYLLVIILSTIITSNLIAMETPNIQSNAKAKATPFLSAAAAATAPASIKLPSIKLTQSRIVELDASSYIRKVGNWVYGTDEYLLTVLRTMADHQVIANDANSQLVINSAVLNLIKHNDMQKITEFMHYTTIIHLNDRVVPIEPAAAKQLQDHLEKQRSEAFGKFQKICQQQIQPITQMGKLVDDLNKIRGIAPVSQIGMNTLDHANLKALAVMVQDMAGKTKTEEGH